MNIVFFTHPQFMGSQSMPRYAKWLGEAMQKRGHTVTYQTAKAFFRRIPSPSFIKKWFGYIDQYFVFPLVVKYKIKGLPHNTLYVFTDHALGPWVPLVKRKAHIIHCHDFLAQKSALDLIKENPTSWTGQKYQSYISKGYRQGQNFVSISETTKQDLEKFLIKEPDLSEIVYNGLTRTPSSCNTIAARKWLSAKTGKDLNKGYILHIGGNQWYKNRKGVIEIYNKWRQTNADSSIPLVMLGRKPSPSLSKVYEQSPVKEDIYFFHDVEDQFIDYAYRGAALLLFPSLAEGFGWPILEAMSNECIVITTAQAPMTEVGADAAFYIPRLAGANVEEWATEAAQTLNHVINLSEQERAIYIQKGLKNLERFDQDVIFNKLEDIYKTVLKNHMQ